MIDDLVPAAVSLDGKLGPHNDWGYLMDKPDSLYAYFKKHLMDKYPKIKGTLFMPLESQHSILEHNGFSVFRREFDKDFIEFIKKLSPRLELAFHGIRHTYIRDNRFIFEFENPDDEDFKFFSHKFDQFAKTGILFDGGKFPGYKYSKSSIEFLKSMNFSWFALNSSMINRKCDENAMGFIEDTDMVSIPTNIAGNIFNQGKAKSKKLKKFLKGLVHSDRFVKPENYLEYLYTKGYPITIQEHYQNQRTDGRRQIPNIYDDIKSLDRLFCLLKPMDIWYANCSEIAQYYEGYFNTEIIMQGNLELKIINHGKENEVLLSFISDYPVMTELGSGNVCHGISKKGTYIFNEIRPGTYRLCH